MGYRLPLATTIFVFFMTIMGAVVVGTQAGFACPDWPLCHGQIIPPLDNPLVLIEWFHRLTSGIGGLLILATAVMCWLLRKTNRLYLNLAILTVLSLALQALAGAAIVVFKLPGYMTTIDVTNGMLLITIFGIMTGLGMRQRDFEKGTVTEARDSKMASLWTPAVVMFSVTLFQVIVGGLFRHAGFSEALFGRNDYLRNHLQDVMPSLTTSNAFLMFHIVCGVLVTATLVWVLVQALRQKVLVVPAISLLLVVLAEMLLGFVTLSTQLDLVPATAHMALASLAIVLTGYIGARARFAKTVQSLEQLTKKSEKKPKRKAQLRTN